MKRNTWLGMEFGHWLLGLLLLFPLCLWHGQFKQRRPAHSVLQFL